MSHEEILFASSYDWGLVLLSIVIAVFASYTALNMAARVTEAQGGSRRMWLMGGAVAMGVGIWSMHFIAMLAFSLPVPIVYNAAITLLSMVAAIAASAIALHIVSQPNMGGLQLISGGTLMGAGIGTMHYSGMAAMRMDATLSYDPTFFALSVVVAVVVSIVAMLLAFHLRGETGGMGTLQKVVSAVFMGAAIVGLHYTGMAAANFTPTHTENAASSMFAAMNTTTLAAGIGIATLLTLGLALLGSRFAARNTVSGTLRPVPHH